MKSKLTAIAALVGSMQLLAVAADQSPDVDSVPPVVVSTSPAAGSKDVAPGVVEIKVKFSKPMTDKSWSWSSAWKDSEPKMVEKPKYESDKQTCVLKVQLEPGKTYGYWINSQNFHGFQDEKGRPAVPYLLVFKTADN
jgi:RNA polymerase sigma-70 factor (ECF subfamily)